MLPTVPARDARAVVGDSMGGYGAMNVALANPYRFGVVESWLELLQRPRRRPARRSADHLAARPARVHLRRRTGSHRQPRRGPAVRGRAARRRRRCRRRRSIPGEHNLANVEAHLERHARCSPGTRCARAWRPWPRDMARAERSRGSRALVGRSRRRRRARRVAIGAVAIGRLAIRRAAIGRLDVGDLRVERLSVGELVVERRQTPQSTPAASFEQPRGEDF